MNRCSACGQDFGSVQGFDRHRVGVHAYTFEEGLAKGVEDGRRCLSVEEMTAEDLFVRNQRGAWSLTVSLEKARRLSGSKYTSQTRTLERVGESDGR